MRWILAEISGESLMQGYGINWVIYKTACSIPQPQRPFADDFAIVAHNQSMSTNISCGAFPVPQTLSPYSLFFGLTPTPPCGNPPEFCAVFLARCMFSISYLFFLLINK